VCLAAALVSCGGSAAAPTRAATVLAVRHPAPRLVDLTIRSRALHRTARVRLMLPVGFRRDARRRWPVLYLLHGCCDTFRSWTRSTSIEDWARLRHVLVVMPDGGRVGFYSNWRRGPAWETFHLDELRRILERRYRAGAHRAIAGLSMGGLGAMVYAAHRPGMFAAAASFSGVLHPLAEPRDYTSLFAGYTADPDAVWGDPVRNRADWAAHDPTALAARLRGTRLFVSAGNGRPGPFDAPGAARDEQEAALLRESRDFAARARADHVAVRTDFYGPGTHNWPYWQRELRRALPLLLRGM
jgi:S-formylglutathione hydrolase FrmB